MVAGVAGGCTSRYDVGVEDGDKPTNPQNPDASSGPFARAGASVELARRFAEALGEKYAHQLGVCAKLGIAWSTYKRWMSDAETSNPDIAAFREIVLSALEQRRVADLERGEQVLEDAHPAKASSCFNMWKFQHESRFKRFYQDEEPRKVELTGKDGGPIEHELRGKGADELVALMLGADAVKRGKDGEDE